MNKSVSAEGGKKILIVEDDEALSGAIAAKLTTKKFKALVAHNGQIGLSMALSEKPDLILLDLLMPVMDGIAMLKKLRADAWGVNVPVIVMSNFSEADKTAEALSYDVHDYLVKSDWKLEDIVNKVNEKLK